MSLVPTPSAWERPKAWDRVSAWLLVSAVPHVSDSTWLVEWLVVWDEELPETLEVVVPCETVSALETVSAADLVELLEEPPELDQLLNPPPEVVSLVLELPEIPHSLEVPCCSVCAPPSVLAHESVSTFESCVIVESVC
jgi:hypothetical protein